MKTRILAFLFSGFLTALTTLAAEKTSAPSALSPLQEAIILAAKESPLPRFNGPSIVGVRPGTPFLHTLAVTGERPLKFSASHLPGGLKLDSSNGLLTGTIKSPGDYSVLVRVSNAQGKDSSTLRIKVGDTLAWTPPMGWNSYDAFGDSVTESEILANAAWLQEHLLPVGWDTVVVDFRWYDSKADGIRGQDPEGVTIDAYGRCIPAVNRFPSSAGGQGFKPLADRIHAMGLKFGIHIMRGIPRQAVERDTPIEGSSFKASQAVRPSNDPNRTCVWNRDMFGVDAATPAGKAWYANLARQYAQWGVDYIKCDDIACLQKGSFYGDLEIEALAEGLRASGRSILLSLSPGPAPVNCGPHLKQFAHLWRISGDFWDNWHSLSNNFELFANWLPDSAPGHWADGDMIPFGHICQRNCDVKPDRWTRFTPDEQLNLMSLWALAPSPLMLGMNLPDNDAWTTAIISNPEVLAVNQDSLGRSARRTFGSPVPGETWIKELADGSQAVGCFNRSEKPVHIDFSWRHLGYLKPPLVRDLWLHRDLGQSERFIVEIPPHGTTLLRVQKADAKRGQ